MTLQGWRLAFLRLASLLLGFLLVYFVVLPLQGQLGLNLIAILEPYFQSSYHLRGLQVFTVLVARYFFFPFFLYLGYRACRFLILRGIAAIGSWKRRAVAAAHPLSADGDELSPPAGGGVNVGLADDPSAREIAVATTHSNKAKRRKGIARRAGRAILRFPKHLYLGFCASFVLLEAVFFGFFLFAVVTHPSGAIAFYRTCNRCHGLNRPLNFNHTASIWEMTVNRMMRHSPQILHEPFPADRRDRIVAFLCAIRSYSDGRLVRSKCMPCHRSNDIFERARTREEWKLAIERIERRNLFYITPRQADQLDRYISGNGRWTRPDPSPDSPEFRDLQRKLRFETACGTCHTLDIIFLPHLQGEEWRPVLTRMGEKQPDLLSAEEAVSFLPVIEQALGSRETFSTLFPHSTMSEKASPP